MKTATELRSKLKSSPDKGFYKVNCQINSNGRTQGKIVIGKPVNEVEATLLSNSSLVKGDKSWKPSNYGDGWYEKNLLIEEVLWFNFN